MSAAAILEATFRAEAGKIRAAHAIDGGEVTPNEDLAIAL